MKNNANDLAEMVAAYIECILWQGLDWIVEGDDYRPLDENYGPDDLSPEALRSIEEDCAAFLDANTSDLAMWTPAQAGHDFCLTRNGHGTGFWDRGAGEVGSRLTIACRPYGESGEYVGDNGLIYV